MRKHNRKAKPRKLHLMLFILLILIFFVMFMLYKIDSNIKPLVMAMCDSEARTISIETINKTVNEEFSNRISYDDVMKIKTDTEGNIVMIQANTVVLNKIGSDIALSVQKKVKNLASNNIKIPLGILFKNDIFAFYGPKVNLKIQPLGSVITSYRSEFHSAGINQTRHVIYLDISAVFQVIIPLARNKINVVSSIPIAESIIVGKVPDYYSTNKEGKDGGGIIKYDIDSSKEKQN